jgi:HK97 family phage portal protein
VAKPRVRVKAGSRPIASLPGAGDDFWYGPAMSSVAGVHISPETAMQISAVYACVRVLAESIASLPVKLYGRGIRGNKIPRDDHPLYPVLHHRPTAWQTSYDWRSTLQGWVALRGRAFCRIVTEGRSFADRLVPLRPDRMVLQEQLGDGRLAYRYHDDKGGTEILFSDELFRLNGLSSDGFEGLSPVTVARRAFGIAAATEEHGARLFQNGAKPGGLLETDAQLSDAARKNLRESWAAMHQGVSNSSRVAILEEGLKWHSVSMTPEDSQFLETRRFQVQDVARWFRVPLHLLGDLERSTHSNIEAQQIDFVVHTLRPWLVNWEQSIKRDLLPLERDADVYAEFSVDGLLRGDSQARATLYQRGINDGWMTRNEVRAKENLDDLPGLDRPLLPLNIATVDDQGNIENPNMDAAAEPMPAPEPQNARFQRMIEAAANRSITRETKAIEGAWKRDPDAFDGWLGEFYAGHVEWAADALQIPREAAQAYADTQREKAFEAAANHEIEQLCKEWRRTRAAELAAAVMEIGG